MNRRVAKAVTVENLEPYADRTRVEHSVRGALSDTEPIGPPTVSAASRRHMRMPHFLPGSHDPGSPRLSSPGSHNPWGGSSATPQEAAYQSEALSRTPRTASEDTIPSVRDPEPDAAVPESEGSAQGSRPTPDGDVALKMQQGTSGRRRSRKYKDHTLFASEPGWASRPPRPRETNEDGPEVLDKDYDGPQPVAEVTAARGRQTQSDEELSNAAQETGGEEQESTRRTLGKRRGMKVTIPQVWRRSADGPKGIGENLMAPNLNLPAVLCRAEAGRPAPTPKSMLRPLPGAFPNRRTLIFFDWDDTLCPTSWIRHILKDHMSDQWDWAVGADSCTSDVVVDWQDQIPAWFGQPLPDLPHIRDHIQQLQSAAIQVINVAQSLGIVCIVTNAVDGWVEKTMQKWLPELKQYVLGHGARPPIMVLYGQQQYMQPRPESTAANLSWVDGLRELTWWKQAAMYFALAHVDDLYRVERVVESPRRVPKKAPADSYQSGAEESAPSAVPASAPQGSMFPQKRQPCVQWQADRGAKGLVSVVSIGDSEAEMQAAELAALAHGAHDAPSAGASESHRRRRPLSAPAPGDRLVGGHPLVKNVKLKEGPNADQLIAELRLMAKTLPQIVAARSDLRLEVEDMRELLNASEDLETSLQRLLRTQTV